MDPTEAGAHRPDREPAHDRPDRRAVVLLGAAALLAVLGLLVMWIDPTGTDDDGAVPVTAAPDTAAESGSDPTTAPPASEPVPPSDDPAAVPTTGEGQPGSASDTTPAAVQLPLRPIDDVVDEAPPVADVEPGAAAGGDPVIELGRASFAGLNGMPTVGEAVALEVADGSIVVRLEGFRTPPAPDLRVYLSSAPGDGPAGAFDDDAVDLGALRGNVGNQNYPVPAEIALLRYRSVVVWSREFATGLGVAELSLP